MPKPAKLDAKLLAMIRSHVERFMAEAAAKYAAGFGRGQLLDIAPQHHLGARPFFPKHIRVDTLDIDPGSGAKFIADICKNNSGLIRAGSYDFVVCTEVLEHTLRPFDAVKEIRRLLKRRGKLFLSVPFNFRIHGPLPDCWRISEHGLRAILSGFKILELDKLETPRRPLMPVHYTVVAEKE